MGGRGGRVWRWELGRVYWVRMGCWEKWMDGWIASGREDCVRTYWACILSLSASANLIAHTT